MCWEVNKGDYFVNPNKFHKVAEKDITVYKIGFITGDGFKPRYYNSFSFLYKRNKNNKRINLETVDMCSNFIIDNGYHSYSEECCGVKSTKVEVFGIENTYFNIFPPIGNLSIESSFFPYEIRSNALTMVYFDNTHYMIGKFIIPKGTDYYENENGEIVSSDIVWTGESLYVGDIEAKFNKEYKLKDLCVGQ